MCVQGFDVCVQETDVCVQGVDVSVYREFICVPEGSCVCFCT